MYFMLNIENIMLLFGCVILPSTNLSLGALGKSAKGHCITVALEEVGATGTIGQGAERPMA